MSGSSCDTSEHMEHPGCPQHSSNTSTAGALVPRAPQQEAPTEAPQGSVCQGTDTPEPPLI